jgi:glycosyltransferase involved in cell wall biosynthesis
MEIKARTHLPMIRLFFDARTVEPGMTGVGRYSLNLLKSLAALNADLRIRALFNRDSVIPAGQDDALKTVEIIQAAFRHDSHPAGDFWQRFHLPRMVDEDEIYLGPAFIIPGGRQPFSRIVTIHDVAVFRYPQFFRLRFRFWLRRAIRHACRYADRIIVPSKYIADQVEQLGLAGPERVIVIAESGDPGHAGWNRETSGLGMRSSEVLRFAKEPGFFLTIGTLEPRKDPVTARRALIRLTEQMSVQQRHSRINWCWLGREGSPGDPTPAHLCLAASKCGFHHMGNLPDRGLRRALETTSAYVSCSRDEGFGLPLVEAMQAGCPLIVSDIPAHREVAGDAALYFAPGDWEALARLMQRILAENGLRMEYAEKASQRGTSFSWNQAAERTCRLIRSVSRNQNC